MTTLRCASFAVSLTVLVSGCAGGEAPAPSALANVTPAGRTPVPSVPPVGSPPPPPAAAAAPDGQPGTNVGRSLILRDVKANLIVDILRDVVPTIPS